MQTDSALNLRNWLLSLALFAFLSLIFLAAYILACYLFPIDNWMAALLVHALLAIWIIKKSPIPWRIINPARNLGLYLAIGLVLSSLLAIAWTAGLEGLMRSVRWTWLDFLTLPLIAVLEELVFRFKIGSYFKARVGRIWGGYLSVLFFAWAHVLASELGFSSLLLPIGPLLLGICCEYFWQKSRSILVPIALHLSANLTALLFFYGDPTWLDWLAPFYLFG